MPLTLPQLLDRSLREVDELERYGTVNEATADAFRTLWRYSVRWRENTCGLPDVRHVNAVLTAGQMPDLNALRIEANRQTRIARLADGTGW